jgi:hypothetical protein
MEQDIVNLLTFHDDLDLKGYDFSLTFLSFSRDVDLEIGVIGACDLEILISHALCLHHASDVWGNSFTVL